MPKTPPLEPSGLEC
jgi:hypothetical protein